MIVLKNIEKQLNYFKNNPETSVCGGLISEFETDPSIRMSVRDVPLDHQGIIKRIKRKNPLNNTTTMFKKSEVERVGGYKDLLWFEDYYLWVRMALKGCVFGNLPDILVKVRVGNGMYSRRSGPAYYANEKRLMQYMYKNGLINTLEYKRNCTERYLGHVVFNAKMRELLYKKVLRRQP